MYALYIEKCLGTPWTRTIYSIYQVREGSNLVKKDATTLKTLWSELIVERMLKVVEI